MKDCCWECLVFAVCCFIHAFLSWTGKPISVSLLAVPSKRFLLVQSEGRSALLSPLLRVGPDLLWQLSQWEVWDVFSEPEARWEGAVESQVRGGWRSGAQQ